MAQGLNRRAGFAVAMLLLAVACSQRTDPPLRVAVAANFAEAFDELSARFTAETGIEVESVCAATGILYAQIAQGAPYDLFLAADTARPARAVEEGLASAGGRFAYATGRLALCGRVAPDRAEANLTGNQFRHLALANPETAPYGAAALQVLERLELRDALEPRLVYGQSVAQTMHFIHSGAAELGFVALAQVVKRPGVDFWEVPSHLHAPLRQDAVVLRSARRADAAERFAAFLQNPTARGILQEYGYGAD